jgi:hypothetical protein
VREGIIGQTKREELDLGEVDAGLAYLVPPLVIFRTWCRAK